LRYAIPPIGPTKTVTTKDRRNLTYLDVGDPNGPLIIHNHGGPSSRLEARFFSSVALKYRLRLICVDRPGIGRSSPKRDLTFSGWADDLNTIADDLGYQEFGVTGWSGGGPSALAAAAYIDPARLRHVSYIAGAAYGAFGDNWAADRLSKADALGGWLALRFRPGFRLMYAVLGIDAKYFRKSFIKQVRRGVNDYDARILLQRDFADAFSEMSAECFAQGSDGLVREGEMTYRRWPFDVGAIERRVHVWQGLDDELVPASINKPVAERMPGAVWHPVPGAGHFVAIGAADEVFAIAADELRRTSA
jgi:pimeloyl-ACP methyl ester carboxylesterase